MIGILRVRFTSNTSEKTFWPDRLVDNWMQPLRTDSLANFWWLSSHALFDLSYTLLPEVKLNGTALTSTSQRDPFIAGVIAAATRDIAPNWDDIDILMILGEQAIDASGGLTANVPLKDGGTKSVAVTLVDSRSPFDTVCQELGHSFGLNHEIKLDSRADVKTQADRKSVV